MKNTSELADSRTSVHVQDFGPIAEAKIDLRPVTVFVGPSNTGKSYFAILLYVLHRWCSQESESWSNSLWRSYRHRAESDPLADEIRKELQQWIEETMDSREVPPMPQALETHVRNVLQGGHGPDSDLNLQASLEGELRRCFAVDQMDDLLRRSAEGAGGLVALERSTPNDEWAFKYQYEFGNGADRLCGEIGKLVPDDLALRSWFFPLRWRHSTYKADRTFGRLIDVGLDRLFRDVPKAYYLPADRTGVMHSHRVVVSTLIRNASAAGVTVFPEVPMLSGVLADFLSELIAMGGRTRNLSSRKSKSGLDRDIEEHILRGTVRLDEAEKGYPSYTYHPAGWSEDLPLMRASSMVSELAPLVLYARHLLATNDLLIIEEPEAHLHPAMQELLTHALARAVQQGLQVVVTTHSEWVLEVLGNLVQMSDLSEANRNGLTASDCALSADEVGVWLFDRRDESEGVRVKEVMLDPVSSLFQVGYAEISETLYNDSATIFNQLQQLKIT